MCAQSNTFLVVLKYPVVKMHSLARYRALEAGVVAFLAPADRSLALLRRWK